MPYCINCGADISEHQFKNFNRMCPDCVRLAKSSPKPQIGKALQLTATVKDRMGFQIFLMIFSILAILVGIALFFFGLVAIAYNLNKSQLNVGFGIGFSIFGIILFMVGIIVGSIFIKYKAKTEKLKQELNKI